MPQLLLYLLQVVNAPNPLGKPIIAPFTALSPQLLLFCVLTYKCS